MDNEDEDDFIVEQRTAALEVRASGTNGRRLAGYAATFNTEARIGDFTESIAPGAFQLSGAGRLSRDIVALVDHDVSRVLARTRSNTLRLAEDSKGLALRPRRATHQLRR